MGKSNEIIIKFNRPRNENLSLLYVQLHSMSIEVEVKKSLLVNTHRNTALWIMTCSNSHPLISDWICLMLASSSSTSSHHYDHRLYQVRCALRVTPRMPVQVETCMQESQQQQHQQQTPNSGTATTPTNSSAATQVAVESTTSEINHPPGTGASRVFQILYRNEEVTLKDVILFRAHLLGE